MALGVAPVLARVLVRGRVQVTDDVAEQLYAWLRDDFKPVIDDESLNVIAYRLATRLKAKGMLK